MEIIIDKHIYNGCRFHSFLSGGVISREGFSKLLVLNSSSAFIWCSIGDCSTIEQLVGNLSSHYSISKSAAEQYVVTFLDSVKEIFLPEDCNGRSDPGVSQNRSASFFPSIDQYSWNYWSSFEILSYRVLLRSQSQILEHYLAPSMSLAGSENREKWDTHIEVVVSSIGEDTWDICASDCMHERGVAKDQVVPYIATALFTSVCDALKEKMLFHAGVIQFGEFTFVFPAASGSGKTTLVAALVGEGGTFFSDELAAFDLKTLRVSPVPLPMSIKPGSVEPLLKYFPDLQQKMSYVRADGKVVRYLSPLSENISAINTSGKVDSFIFPQYVENAATALEPIDKIIALEMLAATGSSDRLLTSGDVQLMIDLIENTECYQLVFSDLEHAVCQVKSLLKSR